MKKILVLRANSGEPGRTLALDAEEETIAAAAKGPVGFEVTSRALSSPGRLQEVLLVEKPTIVHFAGHGTPDSLQTGGPVSNEAFAALIAQFPSVELVVLNACHSSNAAMDLVAHVKAAVGMARQVGDENARIFAEGFYRGLAHGKSVRAAFELGKNQLELAGTSASHIPKLFEATEGAAAALSFAKAAVAPNPPPWRPIAVATAVAAVAWFGARENDRAVGDGVITTASSQPESSSAGKRPFSGSLSLLEPYSKKEHEIIDRMRDGPLTQDAMQRLRITYEQTSEDDIVRIAPTFPYWDRFEKHGAPLEEVGSEPPELLLAWGFPSVALQVGNNTTSAVSITRVTIDVTESVRDDRVVLLVQSFLGGVGRFYLTNLGWGRGENLEVDVQLGRRCDDLGDLTPVTTLEFGDLGRGTVVYVSDLVPPRLRVTPGGEPASFACVVGKARFGPSSNRQVVPFEVTVLIGEPGGGDDEVSPVRVFDVALDPGAARSYSVPVDVKVPPNDTGRVALRLGTTRSATFQGTMRAHLSDGGAVGPFRFEARVLRPRSGHALHNPLAWKPAEMWYGLRTPRPVSALRTLASPQSYAFFAQGPERWKPSDCTSLSLALRDVMTAAKTPPDALMVVMSPDGEVWCRNDIGEGLQTGGEATLPVRRCEAADARICSSLSLSSTSTVYEGSGWRLEVYRAMGEAPTPYNRPAFGPGDHPVYYTVDAVGIEVGGERACLTGDAITRTLTFRNWRDELQVRDVPVVGHVKAVLHEITGSYARLRAGDRKAQLAKVCDASPIAATPRH